MRRGGAGIGACLAEGQFEDLGVRDQSMGPRTANQASSKSCPHLKGAGGSSLGSVHG